MINRCPHCGEKPCLAFWRKLTLGPTRSARCLQCDCRVGLAFGPAMISTVVIWLSILLLLLLFLLKLALAGISPDVVPASVLVVAKALFVIALVARWYGVPLRIDELSNAASVAEGKARVAARRQR